MRSGCSRELPPWATGSALALLLGGCSLEHQYLDYTAAEQVCMALAACVPGNDGSPSGCVSGRIHAEADEPGVYRCILAAGADCDAVRACTGLTLVASPMCSAPTHCEGDAIVGCGPAGIASRHACGSPLLPGASSTTESNVVLPPLGTTCSALDAGVVACTYGPCDFERSRCTSTVHGETCLSGRLTGTADCAPGFECRATAGVAACISVGESCSAARCDGDRFRVCGLDASGHGHLWPGTDCASAGMRCDPAQGCVVPDGTGECDPSMVGPGNLTADCRGDVFVYCGLDRHVHSYDCVAHGWASCSARDVGTADASPRVSCVPHGLVLDTP